MIKWEAIDDFNNGGLPATKKADISTVKYDWHL